MCSPFRFRPLVRRRRSFRHPLLCFGRLGHFDTILDIVRAASSVRKYLASGKVGSGTDQNKWLSLADSLMTILDFFALAAPSLLEHGKSAATSFVLGL
ncbi:hypothetical protein RJ55_05972 [Drechmeria coniospora]|nr:hypothetical protein RJ55_05972 [Drechmeria coniospora]